MREAQTKPDSLEGGEHTRACRRGPIHGGAWGPGTPAVGKSAWPFPPLRFASYTRRDAARANGSRPTSTRTPARFASKLSRLLFRVLVPLRRFSYALRDAARFAAFRPRSDRFGRASTANKPCSSVPPMLSFQDVGPMPTAATWQSGGRARPRRSPQSHFALPAISGSSLEQSC